MRISKRFDGGSLFAGANSAGGFVSFYETILFDEEIERIYILKGGPGTGKSRFMKDAALLAVERGFSVERYSCSSDPDSLDGIVIGGKIAIIDGTAPHAVDPSIPGAREEIINLGAFWDADKLKEREVEIKVLQGLKGESYARAYRYLSSYKSVRDINLSLALPCFKEKKAMRSADNIFREIQKGGGYSLSVGMILSVGMKGRVRYDTYEHFADKVYVLDDFYSLAPMYLRLLVKKAMATDTPVRVSYDPVDLDSVNAVFFPNDRKAFVISNDAEGIVGDVRINMKRFCDASLIKGIRGEYRLNEKLSGALMASAIESLERAGKCHFELEDIYVSCMDFGAKEVFCKNLLDNIVK